QLNQALGADSAAHTISRERPPPGCARQAARTRAAAVHKHSAANSPASQGKAIGNRQNTTKATMVSVPSMMPAAWKNDLRPRAPSSASPRSTAITARPRNEAAVHTNEASSNAAHTALAGLARAKPSGTAA